METRSILTSSELASCCTWELLVAENSSGTCSDQADNEGDEEEGVHGLRSRFHSYEPNAHFG